MFITYCLLIRLTQSKRITIGKLGRFMFEKGYYLYVGSAKKNMAGRIKRHLSDRKKYFWHIDYLLEHARILALYVSHKTEEEVARILSRRMDMPVPHFGSSDTQCRAHLFYSPKPVSGRDIPASLLTYISE